MRNLEEPLHRLACDRLVNFLQLAWRTDRELPGGGHRDHVLAAFGAPLLESDVHPFECLKYIYKPMGLSLDMDMPAPSEPQPAKKSRKGLIIGIIVAIIILGVGAFYLATSSSTVAAQLHVESPSVTLNGAAVTGNTKLQEGDVIATQEGKATVVLYESVLVLLEPGTTVSLEALEKSHPRVAQSGGTTWNLATKLAGIVEYSISTDKAVASVRGTAFELSEGKIFTSEGTVTYEYDGKTFLVSAGKVVEIVDGVPVERDATPEELARVSGYLQRSVVQLQQLRQEEIDKHPLILSMVKTLYGVDDAYIAQQLADADAGNINVDDAVAKSPISSESVQKIAELTKVIQRVNRDAAAVNG
jgi:hypothetical protein